MQKNLLSCGADRLMNRPNKGSLLSSFRHAFEGLWYVLRAERNARIHLAAAILVIALSAWLGLGPIEWAFVIVAVALVFAGEMLNTVVEIAVDLITQEHNALAGQAKDLAAGMTLIIALAAAAIGLIILGPRLWLKIGAIGR